MAVNLSISIGGDSSDFNRELDRVENRLQRLRTEREVQLSLGLDTTQIDRQIQRTTERLARLRTSLQQTGQGMQGFRQQTVNGTNTLTQFSRIAQDAPFGIIGIGNNLTATAEAFSNLSRSAGGAGGALRAVGQSLMGSGGVLLAISLVTTGLTYMSQKGLTVGDVFRKITGNFDEARDAMQKLNAEAAKNAQGDISGMNAYVAVAKNVNLSMGDRLIAVRKLQQEYPAYFGNLEKEKILNGDVAGTVREVTKALINKAKAAAMTEKIVALAEEEEKIQSRINNSIVATAKAYKLNNTEAFQLARILNDAARSGEKWSMAIAGTAFDRLSKYTVLQQIAILRTLDGFNDLGAELRANLAAQDKLTKGIERTTAASIKLQDTRDKDKAPTRARLEAIPSLKPVGTTDDQLDKLLKIMRDRLSEDLTALKNEPIEVSIPVQPVTDSRAAARALVPYYKMFYEFTKQVDDLVTSSVSSTFENLGDSIAQALASGKSVFGAIGKSLLASLGNFLSEMGSLLIKYGTLAIAKGTIDKALTSGNPIVTVAAGAAAIAVGVALKAVGGSISAKASGSASGATAGVSTGANYTSPAYSYGSSGGSSFSGGTVVFEISGNSLIGVLNNTLDSNRRLGGGSGLQL